MNTSDFLTVFSIVLAVIAMAEANNKKIWLYKFSFVDLIISLLVTAGILFLIKYDSIVQLGWWPIHKMFYYPKGFNSQTWAFVISLIMIIVFIIRIMRQRRFPSSRRKGLICYYKRLIHSDINMLIDYLYQYHFSKGNVDNYLMPIYTDKTFIRKTIEIDQTIFLKLLLGDKQYDSKRITFDAVSFYTTNVVSDVSGQVLQELAELDAYYWVQSMEETIIKQIEKDGVFELIFRDKTYIIPSRMLGTVGIKAIDQLIHTRYFDEEPSIFMGLGKTLHFNTYLQLYFVFLCYYISTATESNTIVRSCYHLENKFYSLLPKVGDSENRIANKNRLLNEIEMYYNTLICYCDKYNYTAFLSSIIQLRLEMFCEQPTKGFRYEDVWAVVCLYIKRKVEWTNIEDRFKQTLKEIIDRHPQFHKRLSDDTRTNEKTCEFPDRIKYLLSLLAKENE